VLKQLHWGTSTPAMQSNGPLPQVIYSLPNLLALGWIKSKNLVFIISGNEKDLQLFACQTADRLLQKPVCSCLFVTFCHAIESAICKSIYLEDMYPQFSIHLWAILGVTEDKALMYQPWVNIQIDSLSLMSLKPCLNCVKRLLNWIEIWWIGRQAYKSSTCNMSYK
jgi:hypothetical protein